MNGNSSETPALAVSGLTLELDGKFILGGIDLRARRGEFICVIGSNGAGKRTLLRCVAGVHRGYGGDIEIDGKPIAAMHTRELARLVAYVPQSAPRDLPFTVREFVDMARYPWRTLASHDADRNAVDAAMETCGVAALASRRMGTLSGGERQKALLAAAIAQDTEIMLLDEPATYLDYAHQAEMSDLIGRVNRERGVTVITVTHDVNFALAHADSVAALAGGRVAWKGGVPGLLEPGRLAGIYAVAFEEFHSRSRERMIVAPASDGRPR